MRFLFRADASIAIGTGHVVRCSTLANCLLRLGHQVEFLCRELPGDLNRWLGAQGFIVNRLAADHGRLDPVSDAAAARGIIGCRHFDWLVVDHYELGAEWEMSMASIATQILSIDDIGRPHRCHAIVDQNYPSPMHERYRHASPAGCALMLGPRFAMVRPEFAVQRPASLARARNELRRVLVFMGGNDDLNETSKALKGIAMSARTDIAVDAVIGAGNPHAAAVEFACSALAGARLHVQTAKMAELMAAADLAICAGGSTTWERCVVGLPALVTILAENQAPIAEEMAATGAHQLMGWHDALASDDYARALDTLRPEQLTQMSRISAEICDGHGTERIVSHLLKQTATASHIHA